MSELQVTVRPLGKPRQELRTGTRRQELRTGTGGRNGGRDYEGTLLTNLLGLLSYTAQDHQPEVSTIHDELVPPTSIIKKKKTTVDKTNQYSRRVLSGCSWMDKHPCHELSPFKVSWNFFPRR